MAIDVATRQRFEEALPKDRADSPLWHLIAEPDDPDGMGEVVYGMVVWANLSGSDPYPTNKRIVIRSSIDRSGVFAPTAQNSIRMWAEYQYRGEWRPLGKGDTGVYTIRVAGWESRMAIKLRGLYRLALDDEKGRGSRGVVSTSAPESAEEAALPAGEATDEDFNKRWIQHKNEFARKEAEEERAAFRAKDDLAQAARMVTTRRLRQEPRVDGEDEPVEAIQLNDAQRRAVEADVDTPVRVLAPPGSGKTFVIERRNAQLIQEGINPGKIANVTLTKNMAQAGNRRVMDALHHQFPELKLNEFAKWFCTIHALCFRILREEGDSREVLSEGLAKKVVQHLAKIHWPRAEERPGWKEIRRFIDGAKNRGLVSIDDLELFIAAAGPFHGRILHDVRREFDNILAGSKRYELNDWLKDKLGGTIYITYADMLLDVELRLQRDADFRNRWQSRFDVVNVDEGQDTNGQAMRILRTLAEPQGRFFIVGDTDQLLFRFAGATPEENLYGGFTAAYPGGLTHKLVVNYRSTQAIIGTCDCLIAHNYGDMGGPYDESFRKEIAPRDDAPEGKPVTFTMYQDAHAEAEVVVRLVQTLHNEEYRSWDDVFISARTRAQLGYLEGPLVRAGIPFINATGGSFWKSKHIQDIVAYIRLAHDAGDKEAFRRIYNVASNYMTVPWRNAKDYGEYCTTRYLSHAFLAACGDDYHNIHKAGEKRSSWGPGVDDLTGLMVDVKGSLYMAGAAAAMEAVLDLCHRKYLKCDEGLTAADEAENGKIEDIRTAIDVAGQFGNDVEAFLAHVDEMIKAAEAAVAKDWDGYLVISTVHGLKGQERPVMIGVGLVEFIVTDSEQEQPGGLLPHTFSLIDPPDDGVLPGLGKGRVEDERDIAYVLVSRAQEECYLTGPGRYRGRICVPSRFVYEMGVANLPNANIIKPNDMAAA